VEGVEEGEEVCYHLLLLESMVLLVSLHHLLYIR
jgi:hypothetical protein